MELNERAAKVMELPTEYKGSELFYKIDGKLYPVWSWKPKHDYNHARMLYQRVVEKGLENKLEEFVYFNLMPNAIGVRDCIKATLNLTAEQLSIACCTVLEAHDGR